MVPKIYISQIYIKEQFGGFNPWVAADERLLGCSPVGDVDVPLPQLHSHTADSRANTGLCLEGGMDRSRMVLRPRYEDSR